MDMPPPMPVQHKKRRVLPPVPREPPSAAAAASITSTAAAISTHAQPAAAATAATAPVPSPPSSVPTPTPTSTLTPAAVPLPLASFYTPPLNACPPLECWSLEVLKNGSIVDTIPLNKKSFFILGRIEELVDICCEHESISRRHAVIQFLDESGTGDSKPRLWDLGSMYGTFLNKIRISSSTYIELYTGDQIKFAASTRIYVLDGPDECRRPMPVAVRTQAKPESIQSVATKKQPAAPKEAEDSGAGWGQSADAEDDEEDDTSDEKAVSSMILNDEGNPITPLHPLPLSLTPQQEKWKSKLDAHRLKLSNLAQEIEILQSKDIRQGGLTEGQEKQISKNEERMKIVQEEIEKLEGILQESIQQVTGSRAKNRADLEAKMGIHKKKHNSDDGDDLNDEDDEFFDRTKQKIAPTTTKSSSVPVSSFLSTLTPISSLLTPKSIEIELNKIKLKKEQLTKNLQEVAVQLIKAQRTQSAAAASVASSTSSSSSTDSLDSYMSSISSDQLTLKKSNLMEMLAQIQVHAITLQRLIQQRKGEMTREKYLAGDKDAFKNAALEAAAETTAAASSAASAAASIAHESSSSINGSIAPIQSPSSTAAPSPSSSTPAPVSSLPPVASSTADMLARLKKKQEAALRKSLEAEAEADRLAAATASQAMTDAAKQSITAASQPMIVDPSAASSSSKPLDRYALLAQQLEQSRSSTHRSYAHIPDDDVTARLKHSASTTRIVGVGDGEKLGGGLLVRKRKGEETADDKERGTDSSSITDASKRSKLIPGVVGPSSFPQVAASTLQREHELQSVDWTPPIHAQTTQQALKAKFAGKY